jgi:hypothetical protein
VIIRRHENHGEPDIGGFLAELGDDCPTPIGPLVEDDGLEVELLQEPGDRLADTLVMAVDNEDLAREY